MFRGKSVATRLLAAIALTAPLTVFGVAVAGPAAAHGCNEVDHYQSHDGHRDYWDFYYDYNSNGRHYHDWRNATHDYFYTSDCGCSSTPCPVSEPSAARLTSTPHP